MAEATARLTGFVQDTPASIAMDQRHQQYAAFVAQHPSFVELRFLDSSGKLQLRVSRYQPPHIWVAGEDAATTSLLQPCA